MSENKMLNEIMHDYFHADLIKNTTLKCLFMEGKDSLTRVQKACEREACSLYKCNK